MNFSEIVGFLVTAGALLFVVGRQIWEQYQATKHPERVEPAQPQVLRDFLKSLDVDLESEPPPTKPKLVPKVKQGPKKKQAKAPVEALKPQRAPMEIHVPIKQSDAYSLHKRGPGVARGRKVMDRMESRKDMFILQTVLNPPKGLSP